MSTASRTKICKINIFLVDKVAKLEEIEKKVNVSLFAEKGAGISLLFSFSVI